MYRYRGVDLFWLNLTQNIDCPISKIDLNEQELSATVCAHLEFVFSSATASDQRNELNMQDKLVMGSQEDGLRGMTRFSDNEGDIIWPAWRAELKQRISFEFGKIGNQIPCTRR